MPGRKRKPTQLKKLQGNPGKRALNAREPKPPDGLPAAPLYLTAIARVEWDLVVPHLQTMGVLTVVDQSALAAYCMSRARWIEAEQAISEHGVIVQEPIVSQEGDVVGYKLKKNPACTVSLAEKKAMGVFLALFGMDPSSRSRLKVDTGQKEDPFEAFLSKGAAKKDARPN